MLKREGAERVIVFTRTKHRADACCRRLNRAGIKALPIHGNRSQGQRERALADFRRGACDVLVATDVLARGIDISDVRYVVNFDVPEEPTDYIHRIGRTGRAGELGWALTFVTENDVDEFFAIEALMGKTAELFDATGLELGEKPPVVDPARVPAQKPGKKKTKRGKSTSKRGRARIWRRCGAERPGCGRWRRQPPRVRCPGGSQRGARRVRARRCGGGAVAATGQAQACGQGAGARERRDRGRGVWPRSARRVRAGAGEGVERSR